MAAQSSSRVPADRRQRSAAHIGSTHGRKPGQRAASFVRDGHSMTKLVSRALHRVIHSDLFLRRTALLAAGTASGQAITVLSTPLLTRIYSTAELGNLQAFLSIFTLIA